MRSLSSQLSGNRGHSSLAIVRKKLNGVFKSESASTEISDDQVAGSSLFWDVDLTRRCDCTLLDLPILSKSQ